MGAWARERGRKPGSCFVRARFAPPNAVRGNAAEGTRGADCGGQQARARAFPGKLPPPRYSAAIISAEGLTAGARALSFPAVAGSSGGP